MDLNKNEQDTAQENDIQTGAESVTNTEEDAGTQSTDSTPEPEKPETEKKKKAKKPFNSKKLKHGSLAAVFTIIFIAAVVFFNIIVNILLDRFSISADLTTGAVFTLGAESEGYIKNVKDDIHFYVTAEKDALKSSGEVLYEQIVEFLDKMAALNSKFEVKYVNLLTDPDFSNDYTEDLKNYQIIVKSGTTGRYRILDMTDFLRVTASDGTTYTYDEYQQMAYYYSFYGQSVEISSYSSTAEEQLVSAMMSVSKEDRTVVTFLTGYTESDSSALEDILTTNAYDVRSEDIERLEKIPEDTDILVIYGPSKDYSLESVTKVDEWLSNGGKYGNTLIYIASVSANPTPNLDEYLKEWGLNVEQGYVLQLDDSYTYSTTAGKGLMQDLTISTDTAYYENMKKANGAVLVGYPVRPVTKLWDEESNMANVTVVSTSGEKCVLFPFDADENWSYTQAEEKGYDIIVEASKVQYEGTTPHYSKIIAVGSDQLFQNYFTTATNWSNGETALTLFDTNSDNVDEGITIVEKTFTSETYQLDNGQILGIGLTFAVIIPVIIIIIGIVVWARRRRL